MRNETVASAVQSVKERSAGCKCEAQRIFSSPPLGAGTQLGHLPKSMTTMLDFKWNQSGLNLVSDSQCNLSTKFICL